MSSTAPHRGRPGFPGVLAQWLLIFAALGLLAVLGFRGIQAGRRTAWEDAETVAGSVAARSMDAYGGDLLDLMGESEPLVLYPDPPRPAPRTFSQQVYESAVVNRSTGSDAVLEQLAAQHPDDVTASGVPLLPLVEWTLLQRATDREAIRLRVEALGRAAVESHPSILTPELLDNAGALLAKRGVEGSPLAPWRAEWDRDEEVRKALLRSPGYAIGQPARWLVGENGREWWIMESKSAGNSGFCPVIKWRRWRVRSSQRRMRCCPAMRRRESPLAGCH